jgi:hypothetical protein
VARTQSGDSSLNVIVAKRNPVSSRNRVCVQGFCPSADHQAYCDGWELDKIGGFLDNIVSRAKCEKNIEPPLAAREKEKEKRVKGKRAKV